MPTAIGAEARIRPGDSVIAFNFRPDRMRELTRALADGAFGEVDRGDAPVVDRYTTMTEYEEGWPYPVAFPPARPEVTLPQVIAAHGGCQLHVAETEKYPHVTYFFAGGEEAPQQGERREVVPSPRDVPTYDFKPQMSAPEAADAFVTAWRDDQPDLRDHQLRQRRHGWPHRASSRRRWRRSRPSIVASDRWCGRCTRAAARCSSPPTMATPITCSSQTAAPTPRTR